MAYTFEDWTNRYEAATQLEPRLFVRLIILQKEKRIDDALDKFKTTIVSKFEAHVAAGLTEGEAAVQGFLDAVAEININLSSLGFLLPLMAPSYPSGSAHVTARYVARFGRFGDIDESDSSPPRRLPVIASDLFGEFKPTLWITPDSCPDDPDELAKRLGLPHFQGHVAYRIELPVEDVAQYTPTCLDAGFFEAWQEPPPRHTGHCGLTRHLETAERIYNEFIVKTADLNSRSLTLQRLPLSGPVRRVNRLQPDYLKDR